MLGVPFIAETFKAVLDHSSVIAGRFHVCPMWLAEINSSNLDEVVTAATGTKDYKNFPAGFMMPPTIVGDLVGWQPDRILYDINMLFLTTSFYDSNNNVKVPSKYTGHSTHTIPQDWHDMQRCGHDFLRTLGHALEVNDYHRFMYIDDRNLQTIQMISKVGTARLSGVAVSFAVSVASSCVQYIPGNPDLRPPSDPQIEGIEDYQANVFVPGGVTFIPGDSHPSHPH